MTTVLEILATIILAVILIVAMLHLLNGTFTTWAKGKFVAA